MGVLLHEGNTLKGPSGVAFNITSAARVSLLNMRFPTVLLVMTKYLPLSKFFLQLFVAFTI